MTRPWHGVRVATALPLRSRTSDDDAAPTIDFDVYAEHVRWLAANGCDGVTPNGSLGEYQTLTAQERARVVRTAAEAAPQGCTVMPGVAAYGAAESRRWAEQAAEAGCAAVMLLPPNAYRAGEGVSERALFVLDPQGAVHWSELSPPMQTPTTTTREANGAAETTDSIMPGTPTHSKTTGPDGVAAPSASATRKTCRRTRTASRKKFPRVKNRPSAGACRISTPSSSSACCGSRLS